MDASPFTARVYAGAGRAGADVTLLLELRAREADRSFPYHLHCLLDVSTSMRDPTRYGAAQMAVREAVRALRPDDRFSLTLFSHDAATVVRFAPAAQCVESFAAVRAAMDGAANLFAPKTYLREALEEAIAAAPRADGWVNRIVVLTDGEIMDEPECRALARELRACPAELRGLGFGDEFDPGRLRGILGLGRFGGVQLIGHSDEIPERVRHFAELGRQIVGYDHHAVFENPAQTVYAFVHSPGRRVLGTDPGREILVEGGHLEAGRTYRFLVGLKLEGTSLADVAVRGLYTDSLKNRRRYSLEVPVEEIARDEDRVRRHLDAVWLLWGDASFSAEDVHRILDEMVREHESDPASAERLRVARQFIERSIDPETTLHEVSRRLVDPITTHFGSER